MATRIYLQSIIPDARAKRKQQAFQALGLKHKLGAVRLVEVYTVDARLDKKQTQKACQLLANPLTEKADVTLAAPKKFDHAIEIGFLPGVTDNIGNTAKETLADGAKIKFKDGQNVYSSAVFFVSFTKTADKSARYTNDIAKVTGSLYNPLIQRASVKNYQQFTKDGGMDLVVPKVKLSASTKVSAIELNISDDELIKLGKLGIKEPTSPRPSPYEGREDVRRGPLSLSLDYLKTIREHFNKLGRKPTDIEIETLAQTWSEHCKHTIFADPMDEIKDGIFRHYIKKATTDVIAAKGKNNFCVSVFTDNAGGIKFDNDFLITHKVETHNTPSALDPFGGSITGIVGVNRDCLGFGLGAKPIINTYGFCFGMPDDKSVLYRDKTLTQPMLSSDRIMSGVIAGINAGGNQSGIPTNSGFVYFDERYRGKPLVFAGTVGLIPRWINGRPSHVKQTQAGDLIVMVGGRVGADGIHGATFASESLDTHSPATAVQIGDPITQKKFSDAIAKEARDQGLYSGITDCGAGGLSSAVGEMAQQTGGCEVNLDKVPLKYPGLAPWQIWISESQERMVLAVPAKRWDKLSALMKSRGVEATIIGKFTDSGKCIVKFKNQAVLDLELEFLHNGRPIKHQRTQKPSGVIARSSAAETEAILYKKKIASSASQSPGLLAMTHKMILELLARPNITSTSFITTQYDHEVGAGSVLKPLQGRGRINAEATITQPVLTSKKGIVLSYGLNPSYSESDPYNMAAASIDSAVRAAVAAGANIDYLALLDNFCWCSPEDTKRLWQLKQAAKACYDIATAYGTPFISGKDSMYNDFKGYDNKGNPRHIAILPTLLISAIGVIPDVTKSVSLDAKMAGDAIYILGSAGDEIGGAEFQQMLARTNGHHWFKEVSRPNGAHGANVPTLDAVKNYSLYKKIFQATQQNLVASSISVSRGGLIIALTKMLAGGILGGQIDLTNLPGNWTENYQALFSESNGRILVTVAPQNITKFEALMEGQVFAKLGKVTSAKNIFIKDKAGKTIVNLKTDAALKAYHSTFKDY